ncbi:LamG-like jellyroll fold domain-containing protein [Lentzea albidocapillata]|uniref:LamG-like jellyroll fold domain-containing protein n=1 Tax=Lentzea albidocapillata TaxID=40571 RepID=UPI0012F83798|nr:LamG-like jellyroll fold domain-containing protein [Lentzea albidocapillata]
MDVQPTEPAAVEMASRCGRRVEILASRSESEQTFAKPGGGYTTEQSVEPRWARKDDGSWARVDTELRLTGAVVRPVAAVLPVEFSAGGTGPAALLRDGDRELSITWPLGPLPKPVLSGSSATYAEVLPGVDLKLTASPKGFSETLVVKNREAADNENLAKVTFGFAASGVTTHAAGGGLEAKDASGRVVFASPTPMMWDSSGQGVPGVSAKAVFDEPRRTAAMPVSVANGEISVVPDAAMLKHTATRYPVMIDPSWTGHVRGNEWTLVSSKEPGDAFWQGRNNRGEDYLFNSGVIGSAGTGLTCDSVSQTGTCLSPTYNVRSYFRMDLSAVKGKDITGASFRIEQKWSFTCSPNSDATVRVTNWFDGTTTWNNQPGWLWGDPWASTKPANRKHGAEHGCAGPGDVEFPLTGAVAHGASQNWDWVNVVLHVDEGTVKSWKRFNPGSAVLAIDYNSIPNTPDPVTVDGKACATGADRPAVPTATPTIRGRVSDPDGSDTMKARFEWRRIRPNGTHGPITSLESTPWGNGTTAEQTIPKSDSTLTTGVVEGTDTLVGTGDWDNDGKPDLIYRDLDGYLYMMPTVETPAGWRSGDRVQIGLGWGGYTIAGLADWDKDGKTDIVAREDATGRLLLYPGEGKRGPSAIPPVSIGDGWGGYTFAGVADYDRDGKQDVIARDSGNVLWLYPGDGNRAQPTAERVSLGAGWNGFTYYGVVDRTGDGAPDIIAEVSDNLWLYKGLGARTPQAGDYVRWQIGTGWQGASARTIADYNGDGAPDVVAKVRWSDSWYLYPGVIGTTLGGDPWVIAARGITTGNYAYRMTASDGRLWGPASGWCEFTVDTTAPDAPSFSSSVYKTSGCPAEGCGSLGVADTFTFSSASADVVKYRWGFHDQPATEIAAGTTARWTPPSAGPKILVVDAIDKAGNSTRRKFQFTVAGPKPHKAEWFAGDDPSLDGTGNGHDLTLTGLDPSRVGRTVGGQMSVGFNGTTAAGATTAKVLDTSKGFSVSAWVRLSNDTASRTVVSQQGSATSAFRLGYDSGARKWTFSLAENDTTSAAQKTAVSDAPAVQGVWTHLTGTYDDLSREVRLYVNGALQRQIALLGSAAGFNAGGQVWIGKALRNSVAVEPWQGELAKVRAWTRTITPQESLELGDAKLNGSDVGWWQFNDGSGDTAVDSSPYGRDLTLNLAGGAKWGPAGPSDPDGASLELNGASSFASTNDAVLNTDQSFSVDVWARVNGTGTPRTVLVQHGPSTVDPFALKYDGAQWSAEMPNSPTNPTTWWRAKADASAGTWTHLVVVYDASARTLKLSAGVQGAPVALKSTVAGVVGWNSTGVLSVGRGSAGEYFNGNIDDLRVWQGALAAAPLESTTRKGSSISGDRNDEIISVQSDGFVNAHLNVNGEYPSSAQHIGSGWSKDRTWFADIDGDGKSEIIGVESDGRIKAFKNVNGMNGFPYVDQYFIGTAPGDTKRIKFADIDGDGRDDRISLDDDGRVRVYRNLFGMNEVGQSTAFSTTPVIVKVTGAAPEAIRFADIDGDGRAEFITVNPDERTTVWAHRNLGGLGYGTYDTPQEIGSGWTPDRTFFADITGDGKAEIIAVRPDSSVWSYTNHNGLTSFPYADPNRVGLGWTDPSRVFFS